MTFADRCRREFNSGDMKRGLEYFRADLVNVIHTDSSYLLAEVEGSSSSYYLVVVDWSEASENLLLVDCSCPRFQEGWLCKHLWATLLEMEHNRVGNRIAGRGDLELLPRDAHEADSEIFERSSTSLRVYSDEQARQPPPPLAKSRGKRSTSTPVFDWKSVFTKHLRPELLQPQRDGWQTQLAGKQREAWYVFDLGQSVRSGSVVIFLFQHETKKNGEFGKIKQLKLDDGEAQTFSHAADRELLGLLYDFPADTMDSFDYGYNYRSYGFDPKVRAAALPVSLYDVVLPKLAETERFVWQLDSSLPVEEARSLKWDAAPPWEFRMQLQADDRGKKWSLTGCFEREGQSRPLTDGTLATPTGLLLMDDKLARFVAAKEAYEWMTTLLRAPTPLEIPYADREQFLQQLWSLPALPPLEWPENLSWQEIVEPPQPCLKVHAPANRINSGQQKLGADVSFRYGERQLKITAPQSGIVVITGEKTQVLVRNRELESARLRELADLGVEPNNRNWPHEDGDVQLTRAQLPRMVDALIVKGWQVEAEGKLFRMPGSFNITVQSNIDWFELEATIDFDGVEASLPELLAALRKGEKYVALGDGSQGILPEQWLNRYAPLADLGESENGAVRFKPSQALMLDAMLAEQENLQMDQTFRKFRERLRSFDGVKAKQAPKSFEGTLRDYQCEGLGWFDFLQSLGFGGCLADDMGLGKTVQVLALLEQRRKRRLKKGETRYPSIVVVPKSLVYNWVDEADRFTPKLRVVDYTGLDRKERVGESSEYHLIVTTYGTLRRDIALLKEQRFDYAILDESQAIKNANSQAAKASLLLQADHRLALTGTPIENHLGELWSLFEFLNPGMLGRSGAFASLCKSAQPGESDSLAALSRALAPFMLRRTKQQVLSELPDKSEQTLYCDLLPKDRKAYNELRDYYRDKLAKKIDQRGLKQSKIHVLEALLRLRQAACHVGLVDKKKVSQPSAKLETLLQQIREVVEEGHKALVFSQFTSLLAIVRKQLDQEGVSYEYLDGKTRNRKEKVERFQSDEHCPLFLISLKAGGSGLNLTAADYVFILDPWWNPAVEAQAIDRTHRIGQTRRVFAYRIIARDTVEEKVLELQKSKRELADAIITADESLIRNLTAEDLQLILS